MRLYTAVVLSAFVAGATGLLMINSAPSHSQIASKAQHTGSNAPAQQVFESGLSTAERASLIQLKSRSILAQPSRPLPTLDPTQPFYLTLTADMPLALSNDLEAAGASVVGYIYFHTYVIRANSAASLAQVGEVLSRSGIVLGTALKHEMDACEAEVWSALESGESFNRKLRVLFWPDITGARAESLLATLECEVVEATREANGRFNLETPYVDVMASDVQALALARSPEVAMVEFYRAPVLHNQASVALSNADQVVGAPYSLNGSGEVAAIWDGGATQLHTDYGGRVTVVDNPGTSGHATHVMGTILGAGTGSSSARGFAPSATGFSYYFGTNVAAARRLRRHLSQHAADNHSYGQGGTSYGGYNSSAQTDDVDNRDLLMIQCKSAGNDGSGTTTIGDDSGLKNGFTNGALEDNGNIASFSSRGPMDDGRLMPFISANGVNLNSTYPTNTYAQMSGTSMSSPSCTGCMILLSQLWRREHNRMGLAPDMARAIVAQTAEDRGNTGPDYQYGFGILDVKAAADLILADKATGGKQLVRGISRPSSVSDYPVVVSSSVTPLIVTLSWLDVQPAASASIALVNDLDLELVEPNGSTIRFPYSGLTAGGSQTTQFNQNGPNRRDNIEKAVVASPATGTWTIRVRGFSLPDPNTPIGFVIACNRPISRDGVIYEDAINTGTPVSIPDGVMAGVQRTFTVTETKTVRAVRAYVTCIHVQRGDISIRLRAPDNTERLLEGNDTSTRDDIFGIYPDTRKYNDDITQFYGKPANGTWTLTVVDNNSGNTGTLNFFSLEFEFDPPGAANNPPVANAGVDFNVNEGLPGQFNGTASFDPDMDSLTYSWVQTAGSPTLTLTGANTATPSFTAPMVSANTQLTFQLTVNDGRGGIDTDDVILTITNTGSPNNPPTANAGPDQSVLEGTTVNLTGIQSSDPDGDALTFLWAQTGGSPAVTLTGATTATPSFTAPMVSADTNFTFQLTVSDGRGGVDTDDVLITVRDTTTPNNPPTANAGTDQTVAFSAMVTLNGSGSTDPDGDPLSYTWLQVGGLNTVTLSGSGAQVTFTAPASADSLFFQLTIDDGRGGVDVDTVTVTVQSSVGGSGGGGKGGDGGGGCGTEASANTWALWLCALAATLLALRIRRARA